MMFDAIQVWLSPPACRGNVLTNVRLSVCLSVSKIGLFQKVWVVFHEI